MDVGRDTYTYTPSPCAEGVDLFTFKVNDGKEDSNVAAVVVTITSSSRCTDVSLSPPNYSTLKPPERGESYSDPTFGTMVKRLTDSGKADLTNPEVAYFNIDDSYFIAIDDNVSYLWDGKDGRKIKPLGGKTIKPWWIRWPRANYYTASGVKETFDPAQHFYKYEGKKIGKEVVGRGIGCRFRPPYVSCPRRRRKRLRCL